MILNRTRDASSTPRFPSPKRIPEGFPHQRLTVLPESAVSRCRSQPAVQQLFITHIGAYPAAPYHYVERPVGVPQTILIYCLKGKGWLEMGGASHAVTHGQALFIPQHQPHTYRADQSDPWSIFWIHFEGRIAAQTVESMGADLRHPTLLVPDTGLIRDVFEEAYSCINYNYSDAGLLAMSAELLRLLSKIKLHSSGYYRERQHSGDRILSAIAFMEQHLDQILSLDHFAAQAGQSIPHFSKLFRERTSQSPMAYFIQLKIRKACNLLYETEQPIKQIAQQLGYDDPYYFSRLFKKIQGCSPKAYRENALA